MNSIGACLFLTHMELYAVADMDKIVGWEEGNEKDNHVGARFGACMWIYTKAAMSLRPKDMKNFMSKLHSMTEAVNKTSDFLCGTHEWIQQSSMDLQESKLCGSCTTTSKFRALCSARAI